MINYLKQSDDSTKTFNNFRKSLSNALNSEIYVIGNVLCRNEAKSSIIYDVSKSSYLSIKFVFNRKILLEITPSKNELIDMNEVANIWELYKTGELDSFYSEEEVKMLAKKCLRPYITKKKAGKIIKVINVIKHDKNYNCLREPIVVPVATKQHCPTCDPFYIDAPRVDFHLNDPTTIWRKY